MGPRRLELVRTTGILALKVPALPTVDYDSYQWLSAPPDVMRDDLTWYVDGSRLNGK